MKKEEEEEVPATWSLDLKKETDQVAEMGLFKMKGWREKVQNAPFEWNDKNVIFEGLQGIISWQVKNERWRARWDLSNEPKFGENGVFRKNTQFSY